MSITAFKKITLIGLLGQKKKILHELQALGCLHLIPINSKNKPALTTASTTLLDEIKIALRFLKDSPEQARQRIAWKDVAPEQIVKRALENQQAIRESIDKQDFLTQRIREVSEWGNIQWPSEHELNGIKLWFYKVSSKEKNLIPKEQPFREICRDQRFIYLVMIGKEELQYEPFISRRIHMGSVPLGKLKDELETITEYMDKLIDERRDLTRFRYLLSREVGEFADRTEYKKAMDGTGDHHDFFLMQGWLPDFKLDDVTTFCRNHRLGVVVEEPLADELPPTLFQTPDWLKGGQELINFYQTPGYHALDPSIMIFFSFSVFFAMIIADAGYGLILALFTLFFWKKMGRYNAGKWLRPLLAVMSGFSIIYGVLLGSYWGVEPKRGTLLASWKIIDINNFKLMMSLVIVIGCMHICIASGMRAWYATKPHERMQSIGIMLFIIAAVIFALGLTHHREQASHWGIGLMVVSVLVLFLFSADTPVTNFKSILHRGVKGLGVLTELPSLFGDILSYLRLFALGLAGASLAITFNTIAHHIAQSSVFFAAVVLLLGQTLNFALCLMGAVIHGLRLNYIEFLKWSVKEDGYIYQPFKKQEISHE